MNRASISVLQVLTGQLVQQARAGHWEAASATQTARSQMLSPGLPDEPGFAERVADLLAQERTVLELASRARDELHREWMRGARCQSVQAEYLSVGEFGSG